MGKRVKPTYSLLIIRCGLTGDLAALCKADVKSKAR